MNISKQVLKSEAKEFILKKHEVEDQIFFPLQGLPGELVVENLQVKLIKSELKETQLQNEIEDLKKKNTKLETELKENHLSMKDMQDKVINHFIQEMNQY